MKDWRPGISLNTLKQRASITQNVRQFFAERDVLEVETPSLSAFPTIDLHLESFSVHTKVAQDSAYLITSPEYHMKRLLASGSGSIYQLCKAFRCDETGDKHNPEFTILEWYRVGWDHFQLMSEIDELLSLILKTGKSYYLSYQDCFKQYLEIDPLDLTHLQFLEICRKNNLSPPADLEDAETSKDEMLNYLLGILIEPNLGQKAPLFLHDYPVSQANLAKVYENNPEWAMRFEVYYKGLELGNGFCELTDGEAQKTRFEKENELRKSFGKKTLPIDHRFIASLKAGMPDCAGVAMGFDRLVMLALEKDSIDEVMSFTFNRS